MKKIMLVVALFVCSITLVGCEKGETEVAVLLYDNSDPFIYSVGQYLQEYQNDEINIRIYDSKKIAKLYKMKSQNNYMMKG